MREQDSDRAAAGGDDLRPGREIAAYYGLLGLYFFAFGLQMVLYPSIATFVLNADARHVGWAQIALSAPLFCLLLVGGLLAERVRAGRALFVLQLTFAVPPLALAFSAHAGTLTMAGLLAYGVTMGTLAALIQPVRDAALNGVVGREAARGRPMVLARAAAVATAVQLGAQILGFLVGGTASTNPALWLVLMSVSLCLAAIAALGLRAPPQGIRTPNLSAAVSQIGEGLRYAFGNPVMGPMLWTSAYIGIFTIGALQVLFPLMVRDVYGGDATQVSQLLATFFGASFVSAVIVGMLPPLQRPGRALLISHLLGAVVMATFAIDKPLWMFLVSVAVWGLGVGVTMTTSRSITQSAAAPDYLGRVLAVYSMGFMGGAPLGSYVTGQAVFHLGPQTAALIPAAGLAVAAIALALFSPIWKMQRTT